jgi:hypothetical protein
MRKDAAGVHRSDHLPEQLHLIGLLLPRLASVIEYLLRMSSTKRGAKRKTVLEHEEDEFKRSVDKLRILNFKWNKIADQLGVKYEFLREWRKRSNYEDPRCNAAVTDQQLTDAVRNAVSEHPRRGERDIRSRLEVAGICVTRQRLRDTIKLVDPEGVEARRNHTLQRRVYQVPGPHHLWHIDGNHKLRLAKLVVHGAIDGFSRAVIFLHCSTNNRKETVAEFFVAAVGEYGAPRQVRCDKGGENYEVARIQFELHDNDPTAVLTGSSNRNQRIERFWRDCFEKELEFYKELFEYLQDDLGYDFDAAVDQFVLHYLFLDHINESLQSFVASWNIHQLSTTVGNLNPLQLLTMHQAKSGDTPVIIEEENEDEEDFNEEFDAGEEEIGTAAGDDEQPQQLIVEPLQCPLDEAHLDFFQQRFTPFTHRNNREWKRWEMIATYENAVQYCQELLSHVG